MTQRAADVSMAVCGDADTDARTANQNAVNAVTCGIQNFIFARVCGSYACAGSRICVRIKILAVAALDGVKIFIFFAVLRGSAKIPATVYTRAEIFTAARFRIFCGRGGIFAAIFFKIFAPRASFALG